MPRNRFFDPIIGVYVRERLLDECSVRGMAAAISRETQTSRAHITNILEGSRRVGEEFAAAIAKYWRISQSELHRLAHERYGSKALAEAALESNTHPNLDITLEFCKGTYPEAFLVAYEQAARRGPDRPKMEWLIDIHTRLYAWLSRQPLTIQKRHLHLLGVPIPEFAKPASRGAATSPKPTGRRSEVLQEAEEE